MSTGTAVLIGAGAIGLVLFMQHQRGSNIAGAAPQVPQSRPPAAKASQPTTLPGAGKNWFDVAVSGLGLLDSAIGKWG